MTARTRAILRFFLPSLAIVLVIIGGSWLYSFCGAAAARGVTAAMVAVFAAIPAMLIWEAWRRERRVLYRGKRHEVLCHYAYDRGTRDMREFAMYVGSFALLADAALDAHPQIAINHHVGDIYYYVELNPFSALQDQHRPNTKIGGYQSGMKIAIEWCPKDLGRSRALVLHEVGHLLLTENYPHMTITEHHRVLAEAKL